MAAPDESNDTRDVEKAAPISPERKAVPSTPASKNAESSSSEERRKKAASMNASGLYTVFVAACIMLLSTFGDLAGFNQSLKGSFAYSVSNHNPMPNRYSPIPFYYNSNNQTQAPTQPPTEAIPNTVAMCVCQKQTTNYFEEWLLYHKAIGFDKFYIYDNQETEEFRPWLEKQSQEIKDMVANVTLWPGTKQQVKVYLDCWKNIRDAKSHAWIAFFDVDEFVVIKDLKKYPTIIDLLNTLPEHQYGLTLNWVMHFFNGQMKFEDKPVTLRFQNYSAVDGVNPTVKSMVRSQVSPKMKNPHYIKYKLNKQTSAYMSMDSRQNVVQRYNNDKKEVRDIALYHYITKSLEEYKQRCARGDVLRNVNDWSTMLFCKSDEEILAQMDRNETVHDDRPWKFMLERVPQYAKRYISR